MSNIKKITICGMFVALLIGSQFALSWIANVEIVTVLFLSFCLYFHRWQGMVVGTVFSVARCLIFGFYPSVLMVYLIYYNVFAFLFGSLGKHFGLKWQLKHFIIVIILVVVMTACFTLLDDIITPLFYGLDVVTIKSYFISSLPFMGIQCACSLITTLVLLIPLIKCYAIIEKKKFIMEIKNDKNKMV